MAAPLQIISINSHERTFSYQNYTKESLAVMQQERNMRQQAERHVNNEWVTKKHTMLSNNLLDQIGITVHNKNGSTRFSVLQTAIVC